MKCLVLIAFAFCIIACNSGRKIGLDYHVHIKSAEMATHMEKLCGSIMTCPGDTVTRATAIDLLQSLDSTVFQRAVIASMGYMASMPELELDEETHKRLTRSENEFALNQAGRSDQLYGFFGINPLTDYAVEEAEFWKRSGRASGMKLHLANSDFDFFNAEHIHKLQTLLKAVDDPSMGILAHIRTRNPDYGLKDIEVFLKEILPHAPKSTWVIAHAGGWGGYDEATESVLSYLIDAISSGQVDKDRVYLDFAAVILTEKFRQKLSVPGDVLDEREAAFLKTFRSLNIDNWVFGSDWSPKDDTFEPYYYRKTLLDAGFKERELQAMINNRLPFIDN